MRLFLLFCRIGFFHKLAHKVVRNLFAASGAFRHGLSRHILYDVILDLSHIHGKHSVLFENAADLFLVFRLVHKLRLSVVDASVLQDRIKDTVFLGGFAKAFELVVLYFRYAELLSASHKILKPDRSLCAIALRHRAFQRFCQQYGDLFGSFTADLERDFSSV